MTHVRDIMKENVITIDPDGDVRLAVQMMIWGGFRHLPVARGGELVGVLTEHDVCRLEPGWAQKNVPVHELMCTEVVTTTPDAEIDTVARRMSDARIGCVPVLHAGELVGMLTTTDVLAYVGRGLPAQSQHVRLVSEVMSPQPFQVRETSPLADALAEMVTRQIRHLPVVDGDDRVVGVLSDRDLRAIVGDPVAALRGEALEQTMSLPVDEVMTPNPVCVRASDPVTVLAWGLLDERVGAIPVVDEDDHLVGIVSYIDVLRLVLDDPAG